METSFWLKIWQERRTGFHSPQVNSFLRDELESLGVRAGDRMLLPLCGKSHDMTWLAERGIEVVGVEVSPIAVREYWEERGMEPRNERDAATGRTWYVGGGVSILLDDFFSLQPDDLPVVDAFYDRAALVAMPPPMQQAYVDQLERLTRGASMGLLISIEHDSGGGPPFSINEENVIDYFREKFEPTMIGSRKGRKGLTKGWRLERRPTLVEGLEDKR